MEWKILEFETIRGERPVADFLEIHGNLLGMPHAKRLEPNLYELRIRGKEEIRIIYGFKQKNIYLLHGFKKQKQKTPKKEIETARQRLLSLT